MIRARTGTVDVKNGLRRQAWGFSAHWVLLLACSGTCWETAGEELTLKNVLE